MPDESKIEVSAETVNAILSNQVEAGKRLDKIETALITIAVQSEKIINIQTQVNALWEKIDEHAKHFSPNGVVSTIQQNQAKCPRAQILYMWGAFFSLAIGTVVAFIFK